MREPSDSTGENRNARPGVQHTTVCYDDVGKYAEHLKYVYSISEIVRLHTPHDSTTVLTTSTSTKSNAQTWHA
eukprot:7617580-Pyramimonas_sp.AAC.1